MLPDRVSNPGPLTYESGALPIALRGPACPPNQTSKTVYLHAKNTVTHEVGRTAPGVCAAMGSIPLSHSVHVVTTIGLHNEKVN